MHLTTQLALLLDNRPGALARVAQTLSDAGLNIIAFSTVDTVDHNVIRMVVDDPKRAARLFRDRGASVLECDVLLVPSENKPGMLAQISKQLARARVNIEYAYSATHPTARQGLLVLRADDAKKAMKILNESGAER
jgi:hypothetical protein